MKRIPNYKPSEIIQMALREGVYTDGNNSMDAVFSKLIKEKRVLRKDVKAVTNCVAPHTLNDLMFDFYARRDGGMTVFKGHPDYPAQARTYWRLIINRLNEKGK